MDGLTALQTLSHALARAGLPLAVIGAAGLLENYLVQLAKTTGPTMIADTARADEALIWSLGPNHVVPRVFLQPLLLANSCRTVSMRSSMLQCSATTSFTPFATGSLPRRAGWQGNEARELGLCRGW